MTLLDGCINPSAGETLESSAESLKEDDSASGVLARMLRRYLQLACIPRPCPRVQPTGNSLALRSFNRASLLEIYCFTASTRSLPSYFRLCKFRILRAGILDSSGRKRRAIPIRCSRGATETQQLTSKSALFEGESKCRARCSVT